MFNVKGVKIYPLICNDVSFSGYNEEAKKMGADLIIIQSAVKASAVTPQTGGRKLTEKELSQVEQLYPRFVELSSGKKYALTWEERLVKDANEHDIPIVLCNLGGKHWSFLNDYKFPDQLGGGHSMVVLPKKGVVAELGEKEGILYYTLKL